MRTLLQIILTNGLLCLSLIAFSVDQSTSSEQPLPSLSEQRKLYVNAKKLLELGNMPALNRVRAQLEDYPLQPYLDYSLLTRTLPQLPYSDVDIFLKAHQGSYLANLLLHRWLYFLAKRKRWSDYRRYYSDSIDSKQHRCWYFRARLETKDPKVLEEIHSLWDVGYSQPAECDPVFKIWREAGELTKQRLWVRHKKAILRGENRLARYLRSLMPQSLRNKASLFYQTLLHPNWLRHFNRYQDDDNNTRDIIFYAFLRLVHHNLSKAEQLWNHYQTKKNFRDERKQAIQYEFAKMHARQGDGESLSVLIKDLSAQQKNTVVESLLRRYLSRQQWSLVAQWIDALPIARQESHQWRYWKARAQENLGVADIDLYGVYSDLAKSRSFYGFLAADNAEKQYHMQSQTSQEHENILDELRKKPAILRARELHHFNKMHHARQEWQAATRNLTQREHVMAARLAQEWGWYRKSIESMTAAKAWDDLNLRFPLAYSDIVHEKAKQVALPATLLFAIARQESAWESDAKSKAGAVGLMQLLPSTAKETADQVGLPFELSSLIAPDYNIQLGAHYLEKLLLRFNNNRILALAAYNAGPKRVSQWTDETKGTLPRDVWIETIPFKETRQYVKNVLSYSVVYSHHLKQPLQLFTGEEKKQGL